jgi:hypothetical protein
MSRNFTLASRGVIAALMPALTAALAACGDSATEPDDTPLAAGLVSIATDNSNGTAIAITPRSITLMQGFGTLMRAQVVTANGTIVTGARPSWRSTNTAVATVTPLPDSGVAANSGRAGVAAVGLGTALIIASYEDRADTATVTVIARTDSGGTRPPGSPPPAPPRAREFELTVRVMGISHSTTPPDTIGQREALAGARVTLTLLPLAAGDSVPAGVPRVTAPTVAGTLTTDAQGFVKFPKQAVTRYRLTVEPPAGTAWKATTMESGPPYFGEPRNEVWLRK